MVCEENVDFFRDLRNKWARRAESEPKSKGCHKVF